MVGVFNEVLGREVRIPEAPGRIVSFSPAATETIFALGLGERIVGVTPFCARPREAKSKRKVGSYNTVRPEVLRELAPDLILTVTGYQREFAIRLSEVYPVYPMELPVSVAGIVDFVVKIGLVTGSADEARALSANLIRRLGGLSPASRSRVYVELDLGGPVSFGANSYITDAVSILGCTNILGGIKKEWLKPDLDQVVDEDPDVIVYEPKMYSEFEESDLLRMISLRGWGEMRAVREGKCFLTPRPLDFLAHHGPSFVTEAMPWLAERLGGGSDLDGRHH